MEKRGSEIPGHALALPPESRAALADSLLDSLEAEVDEGAADEWRAEVHKRIQELDAGTVRAASWQEVRSRLNAQNRPMSGLPVEFHPGYWRPRIEP